MADSYLLAGQTSELERLQLQSRVWEPAGGKLLERLGDGIGRRVIDVGCGAMGWLRILSQWVGSQGKIIGTDVDANMLQAARGFVEAEGLPSVTVLEDDLFSTPARPHVV